MSGASRLLKKRRHIEKLEVREISAVKVPANPHALVRLLKSAGGSGIVVDLSGTDAEERRITGWASVATVDGTPVFDCDDEHIAVPTLHAAAAAFLREAGGKGGVNHGADHGVIRWDQSAVLDAPTCKALGITSPVEGWLVSGVVQDAPTWEAIRRGEIVGLSVGGVGVKVEKTARARSFNAIMRERGELPRAAFAPSPAAKPLTRPSKTTRTSPAAPPVAKSGRAPADDWIDRTAARYGITSGAPAASSSVTKTGLRAVDYAMESMAARVAQMQASRAPEAPQTDRGTASSSVRKAAWEIVEDAMAARIAALRNSPLN